MVRVEKKIRVYKDRKVVEAKALFDTDSRGSYFSKEFAKRIGYEPYKKVREIPLAVDGKTAVFLEVNGEVLPEEELLGGY